MTYIISLFLVAAIASSLGIYFSILNSIFALDTVLHLYLTASILLSLFKIDLATYICFTIFISFILTCFNQYIYQNHKKETLLLINTLAIFLETLLVFIWGKVMHMPQKFYSFIFGSIFQFNLNLHKTIFIFLLFFFVYLLVFYKQLLYIVINNRNYSFQKGEKNLKYAFLFFIFLSNIIINFLIYLSGRVIPLIIILMPVYLIINFLRKQIISFFFINTTLLFLFLLLTMAISNNLKSIPDSIILTFFCILPLLLNRKNSRKIKKI